MLTIDSFEIFKDGHGRLFVGDERIVCAASFVVRRDNGRKGFGAYECAREEPVRESTNASHLPFSMSTRAFEPIFQMRERFLGLLRGRCELNSPAWKFSSVYLVSKRARVLV